MIALTAGLLALPACIDPPAIALRVTLSAIGPTDVATPAMISVRETDVFSAAENEIRLFGAINETISFQLAMQSQSGARRVTLSFDSPHSPAGRLSGEGFNAFEQRLVQIAPLPGWRLREVGPGPSLTVPDILVPLGDAANRVTVPGDRPLLLWIDYAIPRDAVPGDYLSSMHIRDADGVARSTAIRITVLPFAIPQTRHLSIITPVESARVIAAAMGESTDAAAALFGRLGDAPQTTATHALYDAFTLLNDHRLSPVPLDIAPPMRFAASGRVDLDWAVYERVVGPLIDGAAYDPASPARWWPMPLNERQPPPDRLGGVDSPTYARVRREYLQSCVEAFRERGRLDRAYVDLTALLGAHPGPEDYDRVRRMAAITRQLEASLPNLSNMFPDGMTEFGWPNHFFSDLGPVIDIWSPAAQFFIAAPLARARQLGRHTWLSPDRPPFSGSVALEARPTDVRALGAQAFLTHSDIRLDAAANWRIGGASDAAVGPHVSAGWLIYPGSVVGRRGLLPSVRLKRLRRAAQDYEYLWLLRRNGREGVARLIAESLCTGVGSDVYLDHYAQAAADRIEEQPAIWDLARRLMAEELAAAVAGEAVTPEESLAARVNWSRFLDATRRIAITRDGVRWRREGDRYAVECIISIENQRRTPITGTLHFGALPDGWGIEVQGVPIGPLAEKTRSRYRIIATTPTIPATIDGHVILPVRLDVDGEAPIDIPMLSSMLLPEPVRDPIRIDGLLEDWRLGQGNAAASFRLINTPIQPGSGVPGEVVSPLETVAYTAEDADNLYIAIRCPDRLPPDPNSRQDNRITYDDLIPTGDDLVEILIDPTGSGVDSFDLYHLVFKRHGAIWTERGIELPRKIGLRRPWGLDIEYATRRDTGGWTVEVRIPLSSFDAAAIRNPVWGINFCRFSVADGTYSNWSGAARYCHNPRSLGNMAHGPEAVMRRP